MSLYFHRRKFLGIAGVVTALAFGPAALAGRGRYNMKRDWILINSLGGLEDPNHPSSPNPGDEPPTASPRVIADIRAAGVSAINQTIGHVFGAGEPFEQTVRAIAQWDALIRSTPSLVKIWTADDIRRARAQGRIGIIFGFQNAVMLGQDASRVDLFADFGVRVIQLTYNDDNPLGGGSMSPRNAGLTAFGHEAVERLNARRIIVDLSHSDTQTCLDAVRASRQPIAITHTGARALTDLPRNKSDEELRAVASGGGYVGIYFMPFLTQGRNATAEDVVAHVEHALSVCGTDHVGIGTDGSFTAVDDMRSYLGDLAKSVAARKAAGISAPGERPDIVPFVPELSGPGQFRTLADRLSARGHPDSTIEKVLGLNFLDFAQRVWGG